MRKAFKYGISGLAAAVMSAGLFCCNPRSQSSLDGVLRDEHKIEQACDYARGLENKLYDAIVRKDARQAVVTYNCFREVVVSLPKNRISEFRVEQYQRPAELLARALGVMSKAHSLISVGKIEELRSMDKSPLLALQTETFDLSEEECRSLNVIGQGMWYALQNPKPDSSFRKRAYLDE